MELPREVEVKIINRSPHPLPVYATEGAAGADIHAWIPEGVVKLAPMERTLISTGIHIELPPGFEAQLRPRSGIALHKGITLLNSPATIDSDYRGEIKVLVINLSRTTQTIADGERIAQMVIAPVVRAKWLQVKELTSTPRGEGGFGHTGTLKLTLT